MTHGGAAELSTMADIERCYGLPGPHLTAIVRVPVAGSGQHADATRWHAHEVALRSQDAPPAAIDRMAKLFGQLPRTGEAFLLTATPGSSHWCRLETDHELDAAVVGRAPRLLPAIVEIAQQFDVIGALVDRAGADVYRVSHEGTTLLTTIEGDREFIHRGAPGGWSQHRYQTRAEQAWESNAKLVAAHLSSEVAGPTRPDRIVVSGDDRAVSLTIQQLERRIADRSTAVQAGGRHEPKAATRLQHAARDVHATTLKTWRSEQLERLATHGDDGLVGRKLGPAVEHLMTQSVETLFLRADIPPHDWLDFAAADALLSRATLVVLPRTDDRLGASGMATILRHKPLVGRRIEKVSTERPDRAATQR